MAHGFGAMIATTAGNTRMPLPITLETTTDAASMGPRRRSRVAEDGSGTRGILLFRNHLTLNLVLPDFDPAAGTMLREEFDLHVLELRVLQHLHTGRRRGVTELRSGHERTGRASG